MVLLKEKPHLIPPDGQSKDYKGFPILENDLLYEGLKAFFSKGITS